MTEPKKAANPLTSGAGILGAIGGWALSHYAGASLWLPAISTGILLLIFTKSRFHPRYFGGAISVTGGHLVWFIAASAYLNNWTTVGPDIVLLTGASVWLWLRPGLAAAIGLGFVQLASLGINLIAILSVPVGSAPHRALTVHCVWRILAIICVVAGYLRMRREQAAAAVPPVLPVSPVSPPPLC
ncbi:MAG TPA: hypothetical protein VGM54_07475 [Chthoniobacter sp.]|jgi:hypothetical protein